MKLGIAYVPEDRGTQGLVREMRIRENISMAILGSLTRVGVVDKSAERRLGADMITQLNIIATSGEQVVNKLSGGNQQKVVVGKWLASKPKLLIVDEPTRGVDVGAKAEIHRLMSELAQQGLGILMISSELPEVLGMSDRVLVMRQGRLVAEFSRADADQHNVGAAMMSDQAVTPNARRPARPLERPHERRRAGPADLPGQSLRGYRPPAAGHAGGPAARPARGPLRRRGARTTASSWPGTTSATSSTSTPTSPWPPSACR